MWAVSLITSFYDMRRLLSSQLRCRRSKDTEASALTLDSVQHASGPHTLDSLQGQINRARGGSVKYGRNELVLYSLFGFLDSKVGYPRRLLGTRRSLRQNETHLKFRI
jgi:hypothetical protein